VYVADTDNLTIRKVTPAGVVTTFAGTAGLPGGASGSVSACCWGPTGVAVDGSGNVYVGDAYYSDCCGSSATIYKIAPGGEVSTFAGTPGTIGSTDGTGPAASFFNPRGLATDTAGNVYVADAEDVYTNPTGSIRSSTIRKITPAGVVTTL